MNKSKSYAEIATPSKYKNVVNDWPDLKNQHKSKIKQIEPDKSTHKVELNALTSAMERLNTESTEVVVRQNDEAIDTLKSRDVIRAERQLRRKNKKLQKNEQLFQDKLTQIRGPKSQKVQLVDRAVMEKYLTNRQVSPIRERRQSKRKNNSAVEINLIDLINTKVVKPIDKPSIQSRRTIKSTTAIGITQRHKGKKSEVLKKGYLSKLKRNILLSRALRKQMKTENEISVEDVSIDFKGTVGLADKELEKSNGTSSITVTDTQARLSVVFSRKFRPYCDNLTTSPELLSLTDALLRDIFRFQDRAYNKNEIKARAQRRYVVGFKESMRQLNIDKVKLLIIAPDLEIGGTTEVIDEMKAICQNADIPYVFSLKRRQLGHVLLKKVPVSCVAILNYQGSEENVQKLLPLIQKEKMRFQLEMSSKKEKISIKESIE